MRGAVGAFAFAAVATLAGRADAITGPKPEFRQVADGVYAYIGKRNDANALAIVTSEGVVLADTGNNNSDSRAILKDIQSVTNQPVRYIVVTQNHGDHVGGSSAVLAARACDHAGTRGKAMGRMDALSDQFVAQAVFAERSGRAEERQSTGYGHHLRFAYDAASGRSRDRPDLCR